MMSLIVHCSDDLAVHSQLKGGPLCCYENITLEFYFRLPPIKYQIQDQNWVKPTCEPPQDINIGS